MIYKFKSRAAGDVIMTGPVGDEVLRAIGKPPSAQGIIEVASMAAAIASIEAAVAAEEAVREPSAKGAASGNADSADGHGGGIGLRQRAWPLVEMMRRSANEDADIVWGV